jgi:hypothetical protein
MGSPLHVARGGQLQAKVGKKLSHYSLSQFTMARGNQDPLLRITEQDLVLPKTQIAVLDLDGPFTRFLKRQGIDAMECDASTPRSIPVFVTKLTPETPRDQRRVADLMAFVEKGGAAVYVQGVGKFFPRPQDALFRAGRILVGCGLGDHTEGHRPIGGFTTTNR